jgi:type I restriction enzyme, S subunit
MAGEHPTPIASLIASGDILINDGYRAKNSELSAKGLPFARAKNINNGFLFEDADCFPKGDLNKVGIKISQPGDVVFTSKGTVGRFAFVHEHTPRFVYAPQLCFWRSLNHGRIFPRWLYYWMQSQEFFAQYSGVAGQTDMAEYVSLRDQRNMQITLPALEEQQAVACILGALDDKIELNRRMNQTLEAMAQAIFKSWFVDFDPVRAKSSGRQPPGLAPHIADVFPDAFEESELGEIPKGWRVEGLDEIATFLNGLALQKYPPKDGRSLPVIKISQLRKGSTDGADLASSDIDHAYIVTDGDVLFSWSGSLECVLWTGGHGALNQHLFKVTSAMFPKWFYYLWIHQHLPEFRHIAAGKATTMGHIQRHHLREAKALIPSSPLLEAMDRVLSPIVKAIILRNLESRTLAALRDTLLPKLISGELRVPDAERIVGRCA